MNIRRLFGAAFAVLFFAGSAFAQSSGSVTNHAYAIGKGPGVTGFTSLLCSSAQLAVGQSAADPICQTVTGDVTIDATGLTAIGSAKVTAAMIAGMTSAQLRTIISDEVGTGAAYFVNGALGTPASGVGTNFTGIPISTGLTGAGSGVLTALGIGSNTAGGIYTVNGSLGTPSSATLTNATGLPISTGVSGLGTGVATALAINVGSAGAFVPNSQLATNAAKGIMQGDGSTVSCTAGICSSIGSVAVGVVPTIPQGRITLTTGVAITTTDVVGQTVHYYTPTVGGTYLPITLDGVNFSMNRFYETSQATTDTVKSPAAVAASSVYDILGWSDSTTATMTIASPAVVTWTANGFRAGAAFSCTTTGAFATGFTASQTYYVISAGLAANTYEFAATPGGSAINTTGSQSGTHTCTTIRATRGPAWTTDKSRGTGAGTSEVDFTTVFPTNKNAITNGPAANKGIVLGSVRSNASSQLMDSAAFRWVSNAYQVVDRQLAVYDPTSSWTYNIATFRQANFAIVGTANQLDFLQTFSGNQLKAHVVATYSNTTVGQFGVVGIDLDSINTTSILVNGTFLNSVQAASQNTGLYAEYGGPLPGQGRTLAIWKEYSTAGGSGSFLGVGGINVVQSAILGSIQN